MRDFFAWINSVLRCLLPPVPLLPFLPLRCDQVILQKHLSDWSYHFSLQKSLFPCLKDTCKCLCLRVRWIIRQKYAWFCESVCWHEATSMWKKSQHGEEWPARGIEGAQAPSPCYWASPRPSHYGPPDSWLWEIIKSPLLLLLLAELDPSWSVPNLTSQPSSPCILPSSYYKLCKHPPAFFFPLSIYDLFPA